MKESFSKENTEKLNKAVKEIVVKELISLTISKPLFSDEKITKITVKPMLIKEKLYFQLSSFKNNQVFHENLSKFECENKIKEIFTNLLFGQLDAKTTNKSIHFLASKKGAFSVKIKNQASNSALANESRLNHNKTKNYILEDGEKIDFLIALNVMSQDGFVTKAKYDKFRQLNRYLEFVKDLLPSLTKNQDSAINIVDFGCGKSYLTFALYYYLKIKLDLNVKITGLDLKEQVIKDCQKLADRLNYNDLNFYCGDIKNYEEITGNKDNIDMVITLHACDTATDYALSKAINWGAKVIMAVPCCQKEVNRQLSLNDLSNTNASLAALMKYGLIKERMSSLITDAYRGLFLEEKGYQVDIMEFIDIEGTPKNILIRAVINNKIKPSSSIKKKPEGNTKLIEDSFNINPTLGKLF